MAIACNQKTIFLNFDLVGRSSHKEKKLQKKGYNFDFWLGNFQLDVYFIWLNKKDKDLVYAKLLS